METMNHTSHARHESGTSRRADETLKLAVSATLHCLVGCGIGEVVGMILAVSLGLSMVGSMALGILPLLRFGFKVWSALRTVVLAEGLSIAVMETFEVLTQLLIPGVMEAQLTDGIFWAGMAAALAVGFAAALPVNYIMIRKGVRHQHG